MPEPPPRQVVTEGKWTAVVKALNSAEHMQITFKTGVRMGRHGNTVVVKRVPGTVLQFDHHFAWSRPGVYAAYDFALNGETEAERTRRPRAVSFHHRYHATGRPMPPEWEECPF